MARENPAAVTGSGGRIYVIGGQNESGYLNTAEVYDPGALHKHWVLLPATLPQGVGDEAAAAAGPNGHIYVIGGFCTTRSGRFKLSC